MLDKMETVPGSPVALLSPSPGGEWRINPTPSLLADPSRPSASSGLAGGCRGHGANCFLLRATMVGSEYRCSSERAAHHRCGFTSALDTAFPPATMSSLVDVANLEPAQRAVPLLAAGVPTAQRARSIHSIPTDLLIQSFNDRILVILTQLGRIGCLVRSRGSADSAVSVKIRTHRFRTDPNSAPSFDTSPFTSPTSERCILGVSPSAASFARLIAPVWSSTVSSRIGAPRSLRVSDSLDPV